MMEAGARQGGQPLMPVGAIEIADAPPAEAARLLGGRRLVAGVMFAASLAANTWAGVVHVHCVDGLLPRIGRLGAHYCDLDGMTDGACTVVLPRCRQLGCGSGQGVSVLTRHRRVVRVRSFGGIATYVLRCRPPVPCDEAHHCTEVARNCEDGVLGPMEEGQCDLDRQTSGACLFGFFCSKVCGSARVTDVEVPVGESRIVQGVALPRVGVTRYTLHCLPGSPPS
jgi:hypothetical protein